jgi:hypothetical protein
MLNMLQVVIWKKPALLAIGHFPILYKKSRVVMQGSDMRNERVLRTTVRNQSEASSRIGRLAYFSIVGRHIFQGRLRGENGFSMSFSISNPRQELSS